jgi:hypothetical protein
MPVIGELFFREWTSIASRPRSSRNMDCKLFWADFERAAISSAQAHELAAKGRLLIACKHYDDRIEMMVRSPPAMPDDRNKPPSSVDAAFRLAGRAHRGAW